MKIKAFSGIVAGLFLTACDPFTASGSAVSNDRAVPQSDVAKVELLSSERRLPPSAHNVRTRLKHFQDTRLDVRFDADVAEAKGFAEQLLGKPLGRTDYFVLTDDDPDWWISEEEMKRAEWGRDDVVDGDGLPYSSVALIRKEGGRATVWVRTWTT